MALVTSSARSKTGRFFWRASREKQTNASLHDVELANVENHLRHPDARGGHAFRARLLNLGHSGDLPGQHNPGHWFQQPDHHRLSQWLWLLQYYARSQRYAE